MDGIMVVAVMDGGGEWEWGSASADECRGGGRCEKEEIVSCIIQSTARYGRR